MDIILDKKPTNEAFIKITLQEADYKPEVDKKITEYSKKVNIKGFRPGKVPPGLVKKLYGKSILLEEINNIVSKSVSDYIRDNKLRILGEPLPNHKNESTIDWDHQKEFEFEFAIGLVDDFSYDLSKTKVEAYDVKIEEKNIQEATENIQKKYGETSHPTTSQKGDVLLGKLTQEESDFEKDIHIHLDELNKKSEKNFIGVNVGDSIKVDINKIFTDDHSLQHTLSLPADEVKKLKGEFTFQVKKINHAKPATLDQEFFDKIFGKDQVKSETAFKEKIKEELGKSFEKEAENYLNTAIKKKLSDTIKINLPHTFLKKWLENASQEESEISEEEYNYHIEYTKWSLIKNKIIEDNDIKVEHEEVKNKAIDLFKSQFAQIGASIPDEQFIQYADNYLQAENGKNYLNIHNQLLEEKVLEKIKELIKVTSKKVDIDTFQKQFQKLLDSK